MKNKEALAPEDFLADPLCILRGQEGYYLCFLHQLLVLHSFLPRQVSTASPSMFP